MKFISFIIFAFILTNQIFSAETNSQTGQENTSSTTRVLRGPSAQDNVTTQPRNIREEKIYQESLENVEKNKNKYMSALPEDVDNFEQYGLKKRFYFKFLFGFGYGILDTMTGMPRDYNAGTFGSYGATKSKLIYDFHFMAIFKPSKKRSGNESVGYGFEVGYTHITNMHNKPYHYWGIPINVIIQVPLHKFSLQRNNRNKDMLFTFGPGVFIPTNKNISARDVYMSFVIGLEDNFVIGNGKLLIPIFLKIRFIFDRFKRDDEWKHHIYWGIEAGFGFTL